MNNSNMTRPLFHVRILFALLALGMAMALGAGQTQASPAPQFAKIATATSSHSEAAPYSYDIRNGCDESGCEATHGNCCLPACGTHSCGFSAIEVGVGGPIPVNFTFVRWGLPPEEAVIGLVPQRDPRPPRHFG